jgi:hypothetical protein
MSKSIKLIINIILGILIAYQSFQVYKLQQKVDSFEKSGQLKCQNPNR